MALNQKPDWSQLHEDHLIFIGSKLSYEDLQSFKLVCTSWKVAAGFVKSGPLLLVPCAHHDDDVGAHHDDDTEDEMIKVGGCSLKDREIFDLGLVIEKSNDRFVPDSIYFVGSSHGWMVVVDRKAEPHLYNLFSRQRIQLPGKSWILQELVNLGSDDDDFLLEGDDYILWQKTLIKKSILTADSSRDDNYKVVIIYNPGQKLAFCCRDDDTWTRFSESENYVDLVWSQGILYALRDDVTIEGWELSGGSLSLTKKMSVDQFSYSTYLSFPRDRCTTQWYIVPSKGEILFLVRHSGYEEDHLDDDEYCRYGTLKFEVFKLDEAAAKLVQVESLKDEVIFVGGNQGISLPWKDYPEFKCNSIYFTEDYLVKMNDVEYNYRGKDFGVFSLKDDTIISVYVRNFEEELEPIPFWVLPN